VRKWDPPTEVSIKPTETYDLLKEKIVAVISIMWIFGWKGPSGFSARSTAEEVTQGIDGTGLTAIVTGLSFC
jgi:hypothetical protein